MNGAGVRPGCLRTVLTIPALLVLAPTAAAVRTIGRWRRGRGDRLSLSRRSSPVARMERVDLILDTPTAAELETRRRLTHALAAVAERLAVDDDTYHVAYRPVSDDETAISAIGCRVQQLGQRMWLLLGKPEITSRTVVWVVLPAETTLGALLDPHAWDPEEPGEPDALLSRLRPRWVATTCVARDGVAVRYRVVLDVPAEHAAGVAALMEGLRSSGGRDRR